MSTPAKLRPATTSGVKVTTHNRTRSLVVVPACGCSFVIWFLLQNAEFGWLKFSNLEDELESGTVASMSRLYALNWCSLV